MYGVERGCWRKEGRADTSLSLSAAWRSGASGQSCEVRFVLIERAIDDGADGGYVLSIFTELYSREKSQIHI